MNDRIRSFVSLFFEDLPYIREIEDARKDIERFLAQKANETSFDETVAEYSTLEKMAVGAGYSAETVAEWRSAEGVADRKETRKGFRRQRWRAYLIAALFAATLMEAVWTVYNAIECSPEFFFFFGFGAAQCIAALLLLRKFRSVERAHAGERYDTETYLFLRDRSDRYAKRLLNSIALLFTALFVFVGSELSLYFFGNSKSAELAENIFANLILVQAPLFLLIKNTLLVRLLQNRIGIPEHNAFRKHAVGINFFSVVYWLAIVAVTLIFRQRIYYPANVFLIAGAVFALLMLLYNYTLRRHVTVRNFVFNKRRFAIVTAAAVLVSGYVVMSRETYYTQPYINSLPVVEHRDNRIEYDDATGVYTITAQDEDFKILHLTDIHLGGSLFSYRQDHKVLKACYALIEYTHPDLVIVTGDLSFPLGIMSMSFNNSAPVYQFAAFMRNLGIPWAFTYGNHDTESLASLNQTELDEVCRSLSFKTSGTLLYPYVQPDVTGRNNQMIEIRNPDGTLNTGLFLIDSNAYTGEGINVYDYIHDDQVEWYASGVEQMNAEAGHTVNSLVFFHIPLQQYRTAYELYKAGSDEVTYFFGENGEKMIDKVGCSDYPSSLFDRALELGSTSGFFCGHDHYNNMSLEYKGIRLTYGMSIDYLVMPGIENDTTQRGAELITLHGDSSWDLVQIPLTSIE